MFSLFKSQPTQQDLLHRAKTAYEKTVAQQEDSHEARSRRRGMALLCCAHLDKTFIAGAERTADWQQMSAFAAAKGTEVPPLPQASCYQKVRSGTADIWVYLPAEFADRAFMYGAKYQRAELGMDEAIAAMQQLGDQIFRFELGMEGSMLVLKFLRQELSMVEKQSDVHEDLGDAPLA